MVKLSWATVSSSIGYNPNHYMDTKHKLKDVQESDGSCLLISKSIV